MRFLIVRIVALGDIAMGTTLIARIRAEQPDAHIAWLCGTSARPMVELFPGLDEIVTVDERAVLAGNVWSRGVAMLRVWGTLVGRRYDRVLQLHPDPRYRLLTLPLVGARVDSASNASGNGDPVKTNPIRG